jgi:hypothetical protein
MELVLKGRRAFRPYRNHNTHEPQGRNRAPAPGRRGSSFATLALAYRGSSATLSRC